MQGTLELKETKKKNGLFTKYTSAYLTLKPTGIAIFRDATLKHPLSAYPLRCVDHIGISHKKKRKFVIHIKESLNMQQPNVKLCFRAPLVMVADAWVSSLEKALVEHKLASKHDGALEPPPSVGQTDMKRSESMHLPKTRYPPPPPASPPLSASLGSLHPERHLDQMLLDTITAEHGPLVAGDLLLRDHAECLRLMLRAQHKLLQTKDLQNSEGRQRAKALRSGRDSRDSLERLDLAEVDTHAIQAERELNERHAKETRVMQIRRRRLILRLDELGIDWDDDFLTKTMQEEQQFFVNPKKYTAPPEAMTPRRVPAPLTQSKIEHGSLSSLSLVGRHFVFQEPSRGSDSSGSEMSDSSSHSRQSPTCHVAGSSIYFNEGNREPGSVIRVSGNSGSNGPLVPSPSFRARGSCTSSASSYPFSTSCASSSSRGSGSSSSFPPSPSSSSRGSCTTSTSSSSTASVTSSSSSSSSSAASPSVSSSSSSSSSASSSVSVNVSIPLSPSFSCRTSLVSSCSPSPRMLGSPPSTLLVAPHSPASSTRSQVSPSLTPTSPVLASRSPPPPPPLIRTAPPPPSSTSQGHEEPSPPTTPTSLELRRSSDGRSLHSRSRTLPHLEEDTTLFKPSILLRRITCTAGGCYEDVEGWQKFKASLQSAKAAGHFCPKHHKQIEEARTKCLAHLTIDAVAIKHGLGFVSVLKQMMNERPDLHASLLRVLWISLHVVYPPEAVPETTSLRTRRRVTLTKMRSPSTLKTMTVEERKAEETKHAESLSKPTSEPTVLVSSSVSVDQFADATVKACGGENFSEQAKHALFSILLSSHYGVTERLTEPTQIVLRAPVVNPAIWFVIFAATGGCKFELRVKILYDVMILLIQNDFNCQSVVSQEGWQSTLIALLFDNPLMDWVDKEMQDLIKQLHNFWLNVFIMLHVYAFKNVSERSELNFAPTMRMTFATLGRMCEQNVKTDIFVRYFFVAFISKLHGEGVFHGSSSGHYFANLHTLSELCVQFISTSRFLDQFTSTRPMIHRLVRTVLKLPPEKDGSVKGELKPELTHSTSLVVMTSELRSRRGLSLDAGAATSLAIIKSKYSQESMTGRLSFSASTDTIGIKSGQSVDMNKLADMAGDDELLRSPMFTRSTGLFKPLEVDQKLVTTVKVGSPPRIDVECECGAVVTVAIQCCPKCGTRIPRRVKKLALDRGEALEKEKKMVVLIKQKYALLHKKAREVHVDSEALLGTAEPSNPTAFILDAKSGESEEKVGNQWSLHLHSASGLWTSHYGPSTEECEDLAIVDKLLDIYKDAHVADFDSALHPNFSDQERAMYESAYADYSLWLNVRELFLLLNDVEARSLDPLMMIDFLPRFWGATLKERAILLAKFSKIVKESKPLA